MSADNVADHVRNINNPSEDLANCDCGGAFLTATQDFSEIKEAYDVYWHEGHDTPKEYAIYGWVKLNEAITGTDEQLLFRFTTNDDDSLKDADTLGDRAFLISLVKDKIKFSSYTYDIQKKSTSNSFSDTVPVDASQITEWTFVYMAYSHRYDKISVFVKFDESEISFTLPAKHFSANYHAIKVGKDAWHDLFNGQMRKFAISFCDGAYRTDNF